MKRGYARCSTDSQDVAIQSDELRKAGCTDIVEEVGSGADDTRPLLAKLLDSIEPGDTLVVVRIDRVARSLRHLLDVIETLKRRNAFFRSLGDPIDTSTPSGRLVLQVLGSVAEFELALIRERTKAGVDKARRAGRVGGNPCLRKGKKAPLSMKEGAARTRRKTDLAMLERVAPAIKLMRPALSWSDTVRVIEVVYPVKMEIRAAQRLAAVGIREKLFSPRVLEGPKRLARDWRHVHIVYALDKLAPEGTVKDIIDMLWKMNEPSPTGGRKWTELQVLTVLSKGRDLLDRRKTLEAA